MIGRNPNRQKTDIKSATVESIDDAQNIRFAFIKTLGNPLQKTQAFSPYGLCSNPPDGSLSISLNMQGIASNTVSFIDDPKNRKKGLLKGEVAIVNYLTGATVYVKQDGGIDIESPSGCRIKLLPDGTIEMTGDTKINGNLIVTGEVTALEYNVPSKPSYTSHRHDGVTVGTGTSGDIV